MTPELAAYQKAYRAMRKAIRGLGLRCNTKMYSSPFIVTNSEKKVKAEVYVSDDGSHWGIKFKDKYGNDLAIVEESKTRRAVGVGRTAMKWYSLEHRMLGGMPYYECFKALSHSLKVYGRSEWKRCNDYRGRGTVVGGSATVDDINSADRIQPGTSLAQAAEDVSNAERRSGGEARQSDKIILDPDKHYMGGGRG